MVESIPTRGCALLKDGLIKWEFGVGEEGVRVEGDKKGTVVIIDSTYPCWHPAAKAAGLNILGIWLTNDGSSILSELTQWIGEVPLSSGRVLDSKIQKSLGSCDTILVGGGWPDVLLEMKVFQLFNIRTIISTGAFNVSSPRGWTCSRHRVVHAEVGGVTDGSKVLHLFTRCTDPFEPTLGLSTGQDLRSVLKTGEYGVKNFNMCELERPEAAQKVRFCGRGIIERRSLLPANQLEIKVRTQWRGYLWIHRSLTSFETLLALDVPEKLIRLLSKDGAKEELLANVGVPNKSLHAFLLSYIQQAIAPVENISRKRKIIQTKTESDIDFDFPKRKLRLEEDSQATSSRVTERAQWAPVLLPINEENSGLTNLGMPLGEMDMGKPDHNQKATRSDDAIAQVDLWNSFLLLGLARILDMDRFPNAVETLRSWMIRLWRKRILQSFLKWRRETDAFTEFDIAARDCIARVADATWWTWNKGSRPLFWKWPLDYWRNALGGVPVWFDGQVVPWRRRQRGVEDDDHARLIRQKLDTIVAKGYAERGAITSLMPFFHVAKGTDDIRMVYDGSASGLTAKLWAPWFSLPSVNSLVRALEPGYSMSDNDVGEMFHNFMLNVELRKYCGMDVTLYSDVETPKRKQQWVRWNRLAMGLRPSPYCAVQGIMIAREEILGNQFEEENVFRWDHVRLNVPGMVNYTPTLSWFAKVRKDGSVAAEIFIYVDDIRCSAPTRGEAWIAAQRTSSILASLGLQDASRKRRAPGEETGAWTGSIVWTSNKRIVVMTTQEKWDKVKLQLTWLEDNIDNPKGLDHKTLERIRGFMVHVSRTYPALVPYMKGLHATIDSWRYGRTASGFKISAIRKGDRVRDVTMWEDRLGMTRLSSTQPKSVLPIPRFRNDLKCLIALTSDVAPPHRLIRMSGHARVLYGFGDASKHGFGASIELSDKQLYWRFGQWRLEEEVSSNYRELRNLVEALEGAHQKGFLRDREVFMFTDNTTAESAFFKGMSKSELLFELVLRLRKIEMAGQCVIHVIHVAGTRMIHQGTDGLSRGDKTSGVMAGENMLSFVPLHLTAGQRSPPLMKWIDDIADVGSGGWPTIKVLFEDDWVRILSERRCYVWLPSPGLADVAVEYMSQAIHKRSNSMHVFICPRLMTARWYKTVLKATDLSITIPIGSDFWPTDQHEPLIFCVAFPLSCNRPWKHGGTPYCVHLGKVLPSMCHDNPAGAITLLRECFARAWGMAAV